MQCISCGLENIPGLNACARCQSLLDFDGVAVLPPRARTRWRTRGRRLWNRLKSAVPRPPPIPASLRPVVFHSLVLGALARSIIPGMGHRSLGHRRLGNAILATWLLLLLGSVLFMQSWVGESCFTGAAAIHSFVILTHFGLNLGYEGLVTRAAFGLMIFAGVQFALYAPLRAGAGNLYAPMRVTNLAPSTLLSNGDLLLREGAWISKRPYERGALVAYQLNGFYTYATLNGFGLDRVVGVPGDRVQLEEGTLLVNGSPVPAACLPLGPLPLTQLDATLREGEYLIIPTLLKITVENLNRQTVDRFMAQISHVREDQILGRIIYRLAPLARRGPIS